MNIYEAIGSIMKKGVAVGKDNYNQQQKFKYRGIDDVMNVFQPLMSEAGIFMVPEVLDAKREERQGRSGGNLIYSIMKVKYTFYAEDGSSVSATVIGEGMDSGDKASNKAMSIAYKYACFQVFCIPTEEMTKEDPDLNTPDDSVSNDYFALFDKIGQCITIEQLNALYKVDGSRYKNDPAVIQAFATRKQQLQTT
jgi:hypothetical protein